MLEQIYELPCEKYIVQCKNLYDVSAHIKIAQYICRADIDVIHTHLTDADIVGNVLGHLLRIPVVTTLHSVPRGYEILGGGRAWLMRKFVAKYASRLVVISDVIRQEFIEQWQIDPQRISTIHNGIPMSDYLEIPFGTLSHKSE